MTETLEKNIRFKAILIYIIVALICGGMIIYIYKLRSNIDDQKRNIEQYYKELSLVNRLIQSVNTTQTEVNLYVATKRTKHYKLFNENLTTVEHLIDSLSNVNPLQNDKLQQVNTLLKTKGKIVANLNRQFSNKNPIESINEILKDIDPIVKEDTVLVTTTVQDTVIYSGTKKGFWKKLSGLFSSSKDADTITSVTTSKLDTLTMPKNDTLHIVSEVTEIAEQAKEDYVQRIISIERNLNNLIVADQEISSEITTLLIGLYNQTVQARLDEIQKSETLIRNNNTYSIISSIVALILIFIFILLIINDVNKGYRLRKNIEQANIKIKQIMDSRHKLLLSVSHDIKTPLNSILGTLELKGSSSELAPQDVHLIKNAGGHILALLNNLLEFSSIEQGTSNIAERNFNLYELCNEVVEMVQPLAKSKNLTMAYSFDFDKNMIIHSDPLKIKQILINILSNSIKYTIEGSIKFQVKYDNNKLFCDIQDTGVGIPQTELKDIFQAFSRVQENSHLSEGSGFGLFVVKGLVDLLKGKIEIASEVGKGTQTTIYIPVNEVTQTQTFKPLKILVIDDDMYYLSIIRDMLLKLGHSPSICNSISEFEVLINEIDEYDEILTDMEMGYFNGTEVLTEVKNRNKNIPVSIITAREDVSSEYFINMGFKAYIKKPVSINDLKLQFGGKSTDDAEFQSLYKMLGEDSDVIQEVLMTFVSSTNENLQKLKKAILENDFELAQFICHKMLPAFIQLDAIEKIDTLRKMDSQRHSALKGYPDWEDELLDFIGYAEQLIEKINDRLNSKPD